MLRRCCGASHALARPLGAAFRYKGWTADSAEIDRERQLRTKIQEQYKNMKLPEMTNIVYGNFASGTSSGATGSQVNSSGGNSSNSQQPIDWMMFLSGLALCLVGSRLLGERLSGPTNDPNLIVPLWCIPYYQQAKYLLYLVASDKFAREQIEREFKEVRAAYPSANFLDWLESRYPSYCYGKFTSRHVAVETITHILATGGQMQLAGLGRLLRSSIDASGDPQSRLDTFVSGAGKIIGGTGRNSFQPPPTQQQWQATQQQAQQHSTGPNITLDDVLGSVQGQGSPKTL